MGSSHASPRVKHRLTSLFVALQREPGSFLDGSRGRSLHRLLPLLLRILDQEQSYPPGSGALERVFKTYIGESAVPVGHLAASRATVCFAQLVGNGNRRLFCRL